MWKEIFEKQILYRGQAYFKDGLVEDLLYDETFISSHIHGTYLYTIRLEIHNGQILNMFCDCPHAHQGNKCKHLVATLLAYEAETQKHLSFLSEDNLESLIEHTDPLIVKTFLIRNLREDEDLLEEFLALRSNPDEQITDLKEKLDEIFYDYIVSPIEGKELRNLRYFLEVEGDHCIKYSDYDSLKFILSYILKKIVILDVKKEDCVEDFLDLFISLHQELFSNTAEEKQKMLLSEISDTIYNTKNEYSRDLVDRMLYAVYQEIYPEAVDTYFMRQIEPLKSRDTRLRPLNHPGLYQSFKNYINHCVLTGNLEKEEKLFQNYLFYEEIHYLYMAKMHQDNNIPALILLLKSGKEKGNFDYAFHCSSILKEEYYNQGNREKYLEELLYLASKDNSLNAFKEARITFSNDKWETVRYEIYQETKERSLRYTMYGLEQESNLLWKELKEEDDIDETLKIHGLLFTDVKEEYKDYLKSYVEDHLELLEIPREYDRILKCLELIKMDKTEDLGQYLDSLMIKFPKQEEGLRYLALVVLSH